MDTEMATGIPPATPGEAEWVASQRMWVGGWRRVALVAVPLVYLVYVAISVTENSRGASRVAGYAILAAFAAYWLAVPLLISHQTSGRAFWACFGVVLALALAELPFARAAGFVAFVFLAILSVGHLGRRSVPLVAAFSVAALVVPVVIPSWHVSLGASFDDVTPVAIPVVAIVTFAVLQVLRANQALAEARAELARLAAENERIRIARDLHDLLGHSLTTITVKAGLARRLGAADPAQALSEIAEVEELCRQALADVRGAVSGYREVTLAGELAPRPGAAAGGRHRGRPAQRHRRCRPRAPGAVRLGRAEGPDQRRAARPGESLHRPPVRRRPSRSWTTASAASAWQTYRRAMASPACASGWRRPAARSTPGRCRRRGWRLRVDARQRIGRATVERPDDPAAAGRRPGAGPQRAGRLLELEDDFEVVASVGRGDEVVAAATAHQPDVALLDIEMPGLDGLAAAGVAGPGGAGVPGRSSSPPSGGPATCAGRWSPARSGSWSRTPRPSSWPTRSAGSRRASGSSTRRWPPPPWPAEPRR